ncbi:Chemotaxis protein methyltransferase [wastewater metagenome]|uniref:protein-glutamate O-methyltransferase n=2 Tax=unclassified sequences TaxID=12908 RepID=A0A5B8R7S9_9ZZZZ|nr:CheR family methyltransferase [Arhodomonas sp. KWT]QEA05179.1 chemotaxis protein methyltransferase [uncultured organism]
MQHTTPITDRDFSRIQAFAQRAAGINLPDAKRMMVCSRLGRRLRELGLSDYRSYVPLLDDPAGEEARIAIDLLTTNETYFFREPRHFEFLSRIAEGATRGLRIWSAACSTGEEVYSIAMLLDDRARARDWSVLGTDISRPVIERAGAARYPVARLDAMPPSYLKRYCLKGTGERAGEMLIARELRERVSFRHANLNEPLPQTLGSFDVIFLRNVLIYFDQDTRRGVIDRLTGHLAPGGYLLIGHSESLNGIHAGLTPVQPSIYRKQ